MLDDLQVALELAVQDATGRRQPLELTRIGVGALNQHTAASLLQQRLDQDLAPVLGAGREQLHHQCLAIAIDDHPRQSVGLTMQQPAGALVSQRRCIQPLLAMLQGGANARGHQRGIGIHRLLETPYPGANLRIGAIRGPGQKRAIGRFHPHRGTRGKLPGQRINRAREHPGMTTA